MPRDNARRACNVTSNRNEKKYSTSLLRYFFFHVSFNSYYLTKEIFYISRCVLYISLKILFKFLFFPFSYNVGHRITYRHLSMLKVNVSFWFIDRQNKFTDRTITHSFSPFLLSISHDWEMFSTLELLME